MIIYVLVAWTCGFGCTQTTPQPYSTERACISARDEYKAWADKHLLHIYDGLSVPPSVRGFKWARCERVKQ